MFLRRGMFIVGPESAGAHPGPICYRKNGYLAVTDANLVLGRVLPGHFPNIFGPDEDQPLDSESARSAFEELEQLPEALEYYEKAFKANVNDFTTPMYLLKAARVAMDLGENQKALDYLKRIKTEFDSSTEAGQVDVLIGKVEASL